LRVERGVEPGRALLRLLEEAHAAASPALAESAV